MYSAKERRKSSGKDKSHRKKKTKKRKTKVAHFSYDSKSESNEDTKIDLNEELHPIGYYVKDRTEMINQMFKVIQRKKLKAMLPPLLKGYSIDELKSLCLEELLGMSEKRIMSVLEGQELETSSESEVHSSELEAEENFAEEDRKQNWRNDAEISSSTKTGEIGDNDGTNDAGDIDTLEIGITRKEMGELLNDISCGETSRKKRPKKKRCEKPLKHKKLEITDTLKSKRKASDERTSKQTSTQEQEREEDGSDKEYKGKGRTLLEILELEMRARAIRALLRQQNEEVNTSSDTEIELDMMKQRADTVTPYMNLQNSDANVINVDKKNADAIRTNTSLNEAASTDTREKCPNPINRKENLNPQPKKKFKKASGNVQKKNINTIILNATDNDKVEMDLVSKKIALDLTKEKLDAKEVKPAAGEACKTVVCSQSEKTSANGNKNLTASKTVKMRDKTLCDNRAALDKAKRRCYRSNQEEGEISSDDENKSDTAHTVKIEPQSDFDLITLDDSNDSICMLPRAERHVTIEKSNVSKLTSVTGATNQRLYSEILRSNIKVHVKNKGKLKTRDTYSDATSSFSKTQKGSEENRDEGKNQGIEEEEEEQEQEEDASEMTWAARWLKSKGVQNVVKTSKVCAKMRKRMKNAQQRSQMMENTRGESKSPVHIIGSVKEYRMLDKPKADNKQKDSDDKQ